MEHKRSKLIWVVLITGVLISIFVAVNISTYADYIVLGKSYPEAFIMATQAGEYPWTEKQSNGPGQTAESESTGQNGLGEQINNQNETDKSLNTEVNTDATPKASTANETADVIVVRNPESVASVGPSSDSTAYRTSSETKATESELKEETKTIFKTAGLEYFEDACFIGDSFTDGINWYAQIPKADYYGHQGLNSYSIMKHTFKLPNGGKGTLEQALSQKQYGKIYILLGINELGSGTPEAFAAQYGKVVSKIQSLQPNAYIFIQSILHTTQKKTVNSKFKNPLINAENEALSKLADNKKVFYIDINPLFDDETGALRADYSKDGVHIKAPYYIEWRDYLLKHTVH